MTVRILVDTNVFLYSRDTRFPEKQARAEAWLRALIRSGAMVTSQQVAGEHQNAAVRKFGRAPAEAAAASRDILRWCPGVMEIADTERAMDIYLRWKTQWWDAVHIAFALSQVCTHFLSEDRFSAPTIEGIGIVNPFDVAPADVLGAA